MHSPPYTPWGVPMNRTVALGVLILFSIPVHATDLACADGVRPLVKFTSFVFSRKGDPRIPFSHVHSAALVCQDRRLLKTEVLQSPPVQIPNSTPLEFPFNVSIRKGSVTAGSYQALIDALSKARAGVMTGCSLPDRRDSDEAIRVTWFGRTHRTKTFDIATSVEGAVTDHACTAEEEALYAALARLQFDLTKPFDIQSF